MSPLLSSPRGGRRRFRRLVQSAKVDIKSQPLDGPEGSEANTSKVCRRHTELQRQSNHAFSCWKENRNTTMQTLKHKRGIVKNYSTTSFFTLPRHSKSAYLCYYVKRTYRRLLDLGLGKQHRIAQKRDKLRVPVATDSQEAAYRLEVQVARFGNVFKF